MESYVRKCTLFAIIFVIAGLLVGFRSYTRSKVELVPALEVIEPDYTQPSAVVEAELTKLTTRVYKADDVNLPDDSIPEHKNAVEPPTTEETVTESVEMTEYATEPETAEVQTITQAPEIGRYASLVNLISDDDKELLARLIYHESRGVGGEAVCETVFNRMLSDEFPDSVYDVINQKNQFEPAGILWSAEIKEPEAMARSREIVDEVLYATGDYFIPEDYCYFHSRSIREPQSTDYEYSGNVFFKNYA